jgi:Holliday junction DNA helicase RuvA
VLPPADLARAVAEEDKASVARASGVGPKLALRIVTELRGKSLGAASPLSAAPSEAPKTSAGGEATLALMGLGIGEAQARRAVDEALRRLDGPDLSTLIKAALQEAAK